MTRKYLGKTGKVSEFKQPPVLRNLDTSHLLPVGLLSSAAAPGTGPAVAADGPAPVPTAPVPPLLPLAHAPYPRPPGPSEMFSESTGR